MGKVAMNDKSWESLNTLVTGLAEKEFEKGESFLYGGARLFPEEVADMLLPSILCLAQGISRYVGMGEFGYDFGFVKGTSAAFPLCATPTAPLAPFHLVAPFVVEVFDTYVLEGRADVARVFEAAAQTLDGDFSLERNTCTG